MENNTSIYQKLQKMRVELQKAGVVKSGRNDYGKYDYFELSDFLPQINEIQAENNTVSLFSINETRAVLDILNCEDLDQRISFSIPLAELSLKGANAIQNVGGLTTYCRRYLYMIAFEIAENDEFDGDKKDEAEPEPKPEQEPEVLYVNDNHIKTLKQTMEKKGVTDQQMLGRFKINTYEEMRVDWFVSAMRMLEITPDKEEKQVDLGL